MVTVSVKVSASCVSGAGYSDPRTPGDAWTQRQQLSVSDGEVGDCLEEFDDGRLRRRQLPDEPLAGEGVDEAKRQQAWLLLASAESIPANIWR
jgi:hypothetical protein